MKLTFNLPFVIGMASLFTACLGEDRSDEQPFPPLVRTLSPIVQEDSVFFTGEILDSPNSRITGRGFYYGNDTLRLQATRPDSVTGVFRDTIEALKPGTYYVCAFATNGMGTSHGDTLFFDVAK